MSDRDIVGAVDIGGTKIAVGAVDADGTVLERQEVSTRAGADFGTGMGHIASMLSEIQRKRACTFRGIGVGCTGPVDPFSGVVGDVEFLPGWLGCNLVERLHHALGVSVAMENDADAAALAEATWGAGRGKAIVICVTVGTGIGAGIVLHGSLYRGVGGTHPEVGHHVIDVTGPLCYCGARGCWEVLARGPAMAERMRTTTSVDALHSDALTGKAICELARLGDPAAIAEVKREGTYLGVGVANVITLFAPDVVVLGGSVMNSADLFMPTIVEVVNGSCGLVDSASTTLAVASLGSDTPLIGASMVWRSRYGDEARTHRGASWKS